MTRIYETFSIRWSDGARWSGYDSAAEAQAVIDFAASRGGRSGQIVRHEFTVEAPERLAHLYRPGI